MPIFVPLFLPVAAYSEDPTLVVENKVPLAELKRLYEQLPAPNEKENFKGDSVEFWGQDGEVRVCCEITRSALDDHFGGNGKDNLAVFRANRRGIEEIARRRYLAGSVEKSGSVYIDSPDV